MQQCKLPTANEISAGLYCSFGGLSPERCGICEASSMSLGRQQSKGKRTHDGPRRLGEPMTTDPITPRALSRRKFAIRAFDAGRSQQVRLNAAHFDNDQQP
jgi:hypothetical protein